MTATSIVLRFIYPSFEENRYSDIRTFRVNEFGVLGSTTSDLYRFTHPSSGLSIGSTVFERKNAETDEWKQVGNIEWTSDLTGTVDLGGEEISIKDLRKVKYGTSTSRRFRYQGREYKWRISENEVDLHCLDPEGFVVASWNQQRQQLWLHSRRPALVERFLVTCLLNLWFRMQGAW